MRGVIMESIGKYLRERRESLGMSIEEIANETRLKPYIINQIETNDFRAIEDVGFIKVLVITYCRALQGDEERVQSKLNQLFDKPSEPPIPIDTAKPKKPIILPNNLIWFVSLGLLIVVLTIGFVQLYQSEAISLNAIKYRLAETTKKSTSSSTVSVATPDTLWEYQQRIFEEVSQIAQTVEETVNVRPARERPVREKSVSARTATVDRQSERRYVGDENDYIGQLIFNNVESPLNPRQ
jgi:cytoskeletal protein RodZ